ncbi:MotA/TolQ/ExbB proton channel family protein [Thalassotalea sp. G20_0]|uniref:MotA/TolQ/ExbB proton channel family protein n=1 Tax=Thalassotalea sp. G20_0 TaxID=2821093 RepID=UPI001ADB257C|nr:MotA/TolQ/ExbB proton channel family protein [Thalassotalea sp. G20_0]MBO9493536.1 MotA/TolQ/ExbB proton channel family protein [Thalassotalea sp. G20_0]
MFDMPWSMLQDFLDQGGPVLMVIGTVTVFLWSLILDRVLYLKKYHRAMVQQVIAGWHEHTRGLPKSEQPLRRRLTRCTMGRVDRNMPLIKTIIAVCPLLGLLGTVTGMVEVFEVMSVAGTGNARAMAAGVSRATIPTMAGMVVALSGLLAMLWLKQRCNKERDYLNRQLSLSQNQGSVPAMGTGLRVTDQGRETR